MIDIFTMLVGVTFLFNTQLAHIDNVEATTTPAVVTTVSVEHIEKLIRKEAVKVGANPDVAVAVAKAESGLNNKAFNPEWHNNCQGSFGVFQMACIHTSNPVDLFNPEFNIKLAMDLYKQEGWHPWGVCTRGLVKCF